ncbi:phosphoribosylaminoimidazole-succinocarboxamide synthase [Apiospora saccharicola]|uniref:Phosphoribosylaminoimidazole-succinocarboxamide synthase n=1 Tax=Apiospora saccharicola TaxID=335842 RepID=A0ABR1V9P4_9PEZI
MANSQGLPSNYVDQNRSNQTYRTFSSAATPTTTSPSQATVLHLPIPEFRHLRPQPHDRPEVPASPSPISTIAPFVPSPPPPVGTAYGSSQHPSQQRAVTYQVPEPVAPRQLVRFHQKPNAMSGPQYQVLANEVTDDMLRATKASITPGIDDTPYIQHAIEALTRQRNSRGLSGVPSSGAGEENPMMRYMPDTVPGLFDPLPQHESLSQTDAANYYEDVDPEELLATRRLQRALADIPPTSDAGGQQTAPPREQVSSPEGSEGILWGDQSGFWRNGGKAMLDNKRPKHVHRSPRNLPVWHARSDVDANNIRGHPPLTFKPWILRTPSLLILAVLCTLMIAALMFCAIYSDRHDGLVGYAGSMTGGQYFVFRIMPQLIAAVLLIYAQCVMTAVFRVLPFSAMASDDLRYRRGVGFLPLYPKSFLWPQLVSTWQVWIPVIVTWIANLTIPLQSTLFTVIIVDGKWSWATVQGVAWVLVALYVLLLISTVVLIIFWHNRRTGMRPGWDVRNIADVIHLVAQSNSTHLYDGTETAASRAEMRDRLDGNRDRIGYWSTPDAPNWVWHGIGHSTNDEKVDMEHFGASVHERDSRSGMSHRPLANGSDLRHSYLPWCLRTSQVILWAVAGSVLIIALFVVSFIPSTDIRRGFLPALKAGPIPGAFSAADFVYSFIPSLIGLVLFLLFQSLDLTLRILTPWGELTRKEGSRASTSLLADYAACLPLQATWRALKNRHWRVACISFLANLFILIPVLAGGLFMAMTPPAGDVRMYPNMAAYAVVLTLLVLYVLSLISLIPKRAQFGLPHAVTCVAEIISFCANDELLAEDAFQWPHSRKALKGKLDAYADLLDQSRWSIGDGRHGEEKFGIRRLIQPTGPPSQRLHPKLHDPDTLERAKIMVMRGSHVAHNISRPVNTGNSQMLD